MWALLAAVLVLPAAVVGGFWALATRPARLSCGVAEPPGHAAAYSTWLHAAQVAHLAAAAVLLAAIVYASACRARLAGRPFQASKLTLAAVVAVAVLALVSPAVPVLLAPWFLLVFFAALYASTLGTAGAVAAAAGGTVLLGWLAAAPVRAADAAGMRRWLRAVSLLAWVLLLAGVPAAFELAWVMGGRPIFC
jgi:hypothetical protein